MAPAGQEQLNILLQALGGGNADALFGALLADDGQHDPLAPVVDIDLLAGGQVHAGHIGHKALGLGQRNGRIHTVPLGLAIVQEGHVGLAVGLHLGLLGLADAVQTVLGFVEQFVTQFAHMNSSYRASCCVVGT